MDAQTAAAVKQVVTAVFGGARRATKYLSPKWIVRATAPNFKRSNDVRHGQMVLTIGRPAYAERQFIKAAKKAGEPFPVKKVQLKMPRKRA